MFNISKCQFWFRGCTTLHILKSRLCGSWFGFMLILLFIDCIHIQMCQYQYTYIVETFYQCNLSASCQAADHTLLQWWADEYLCMHSTSNLEQQKTTAATILTANNMKVCIWRAQTYWNWTIEDWETPGRKTHRVRAQYKQHKSMHPSLSQQIRLLVVYLSSEYFLGMH